MLLKIFLMLGCLSLVGLAISFILGGEFFIFGVLSIPVLIFLGIYLFYLLVEFGLPAIFSLLGSIIMGTYHNAELITAVVVVVTLLTGIRFFLYDTKNHKA